MLREIISYDWLIIFCVLGLVFITLAKVLFAHRFADFISVLGNSKYLKIYARDQKFIDTFDSILFVNLVLSISVFSFVAYSVFESKMSFDLINFFKLTFAIASIFLIKVLIERLIGSLFDIDQIIDTYLFQKTTYKNYSGFILLPANLILLFALTPSKLAVYIVFGLIVLVNLIGFLTSVKTYQKLVLSNIFYFILYLCALEIGPYVILYKVFKAYNT